MKQISKLFKLLTLVMAMVALGTTNAYAGGSSKTYYAKATATATGNGKVYVGTSNSTPSEDKYQETSEATKSGSSSGSSATVDFYLFAEPSDATIKFDGWYDNAEFSGDALSTANPYNAKITSSSTSQNTAVTKNYYAKFIEATEFYSSTFTVTCVGEGGSVAVSTESGNEDFGAEKSASNLNDVEAAHTYYLQAKLIDADVYRFVGWYSDEACENQLSTNANYTYKVTAESTDEAVPTQFHAYAKFEVIPYFYSNVTATALGKGKVNVSTSNRAGEYLATSEASQKVADKNEHTYYLKAQAETDILFDGWFATEDCEGEPLSKELNHTVKVSDCSGAEETPTLQNYYAKFSEVPVLRYETARLYLNIGDEPAANDDLVCKNTTVTGYTSSNPAVATVAEDGKVTPVAVGSTIITVSAEGVEDATYVATVLDYSEAGKTQIGNSDFEDWSNVTSSNHAPKNWNSFETAEGSFASMAGGLQVQMVQQNRPGSNGLYCADIFAKDVKLGSIKLATAQGNLTLGFINAGATTAVSADNHNRSKITDPSKSETIDKIPTAIKVWVKFVPAKENAAHPNARIAATIHDAYNYITQGAPQFETDANAAHAVAQAACNFPACEWTELIIPFELTGNAIADGQMYIIVNASTNADPGQGQADDHLYIDDIELVYDTDYDEVGLSMTSANWATFCAPMDVNVPYGMKAYTVDGVDADDETVLALTEVEDVIPANTPVVLEGTVAASLKAYGFATPATAEAGMLTGVYEDTTAPVGSYVLQKHEDVVGFYQVEDVQPTVKANRAYMNIPAGVKAFFFNAQDAATAISKITAENANKTIYDLNGRQLQKLQKGINIVNGVKVLVK